jgi:hypothetical protein
MLSLFKQIGFVFSDFLCELIAVYFVVFIVLIIVTGGFALYAHSWMLFVHYFPFNILASIVTSFVSVYVWLWFTL